MVNFKEETNESLSTLSLKLSSYGWLNPEKANITEIDESIKANEYLKIYTTLNSIKQKNVDVQYFPKNVDGTKIISALKEQGFTLKIGNSQVTEIPTNSIWYGSNVKIEDAKLVALTLIRAGIKIRLISIFLDKENRKNLIQVGAHPGFESAKPITVDEIVRAHEFSVDY